MDIKLKTEIFNRYRYDIIKIIFVLLSIFMIYLISSCGNGDKKAIEKTKSKSINKNVNSRFVVNFYIDNSGSMDGYINGPTDFKDAIYNYLALIKNSEFLDSLFIFYINNRIIPQGSDINNFIGNLNLKHFTSQGGSREATDIDKILKLVLNETDSTEIAILVTDGIFSPGRGKNANDYLLSQQIGIRTNFESYLKNFPNTGVVIYQLSSKFNGFYYNRNNFRIKINEERPYYIWLIGPSDYLNHLLHEVFEKPLIGTNSTMIQNVFSILGEIKQVDYAIKLGSGNFNLDKSDPKKIIENLRSLNKGTKNTVRFSINVNLSGLLLSDNYLSDTSNYDLNKKYYSFRIKKSLPNNSGYTHQFDFESNIVHKGNISVKLKKRIPEWVDIVNDDDGTYPIENKTFGIKYQIYGVYEAFTRKNNYYTEIKILIK